MKTQPVLLYLPDERGVELANYGNGNAKLGFGVFTFSRIPGNGQTREPPNPKLAGTTAGIAGKLVNPHGTCPGSTPECEAICYAKRVKGVVQMIWRENSESDYVPPIPQECRVLRIHVSGDFDSPGYIVNWFAALKNRPDVTAWAYTRSWRVPALLPFLEQLRTLPNLQLFASMDPSTVELPPAGWRRAWILRTDLRNQWPAEVRLDMYRSRIPLADERGFRTYRLGDLMTRCNLDREPSYVCPEETGRKANCAECGYCFEGQKHDVTFLEH